MIQSPQKLFPSTALKKGADLWIVSNPENSRWSAKIDWLTGFQIQKSKRYGALPDLSAQVRQMIHQSPHIFQNVTAMAEPQLEQKKLSPSASSSFSPSPPSPPQSEHPGAPAQAQDQARGILVSTASRLPNLWTVEISSTGKEWIDRACDIWRSLNCPILRLFAPLKINKQDIEKKWGENTPLQYILEEQ